MENDKESRTILIFKKNNNDFKIENINSEFINKSGNKFIEFNKLLDSTNTFSTLNSNNIQCKYCYYNAFIRFDFKDLNKEQITDLIINQLENVFKDINIIKLNLFENNDSLIGSGILVLDRLSDLKLLLKKKQIELDDNLKLNIYKYNTKRK